MSDDSLSSTHILAKLHIAEIQTIAHPEIKGGVIQKIPRLSFRITPPFFEEKYLLIISHPSAPKIGVD